MTASDGVRGLWLVIPLAAALAAAAGGPEPSLIVLGPLVTSALPLIILVAFWWDDWPGTRLGAAWSGWADTALVAAGGVALAALGQWVAGGLDARGLFDPSAGPGHVPAFPATLPLAGAVFVAMLQLTLVGDGWPLRRLPEPAAGLAALALAWAVGLALYLTLVAVEPAPGSRVVARTGPVSGADLGAVVACVGAWQVLCFVVLRGRAPSAVAPGHALVLGGGLLTFFGLRSGLDASRVTAVAGCFVAGGLLTGMVLEFGVGRLLGVGAALLVAVALFAALSALAGHVRFTRASADDWVAHATLNALAASTLLYVAIGRRWPFARRPT